MASVGPEEIVGALFIAAGVLLALGFFFFDESGRWPK